MPRFYLPQLSATPLELTGDEAHHLAHVMRAKVGDRVSVFDGAGNECFCSIADVAKKSVQLKILQRHCVPPLPHAITLAQALPKGAAMDLIIEKAAELGARTIQPLLSERSVVKLSEEEAKKKLDRWRHIAVEACKQCGNNWLPEIAPIKTAADFLRGPLKHNLKLIASLQPNAKPLRHILQSQALGHSSTHALLLIGPEGDFTPAELAAALSAGCAPLSLGPLILRSETAAIAALSVLAYEMNLVT